MLKLLLLFRFYLYPIFEFISYKSFVFSKVFLPLYWRFFWATERQLEAIELGKKGTSLYESERAVLIEKILYRTCNPKILEVGFGYGQNMSVLVELLPKKNIHGIDFKENRVSETIDFFLNNNISEITIKQGDGRSLDFADSSFDVVFTSAVMLYLNHEDCKKMLSEMLRVSRARVVLLEQHREGASDLLLKGGVTGEDYYVRDYNQLIKEVLSEAKYPAIVKTHKVSNPRWQVESWKDIACVFVIDKGP